MEVTYDAFDPIGRVQKTTQTVNVSTYTFQVTYTPPLGIQWITYPTTNRVVTTGCDSAGRTSTLTGKIFGSATKTPSAGATSYQPDFGTLYSQHWRAGA